MAKGQNSVTDTDDTITDFSFDSDNTDFFEIKAGTLGKKDVAEQVKKASMGADLDDDDDDPDGSTDLDADDSKERAKKASATPLKPTKKEEPRGKDKKPTKEEDINDDEDNDDKDDEQPFEDKKVKKTEAKTKAKIDEDDDEEDEDTKDDEDEDEEDVYGSWAKELKENGVFASIDIPKDEKITKDKLFELHEEEFEARLDATFEDFFKEMDEEGKAFLKFKREGGNTKVFLETYGKTLELEDFDEAKPEHVNRVIRYYIKTHEPELDEEDVEDRIKYAKESGKAASTAKKYYNIIQKDEKDRKEAIQKIQEKAKNTRDSEAKEFDETLKDFLLKTDTVGPFTLTKTEQKELATYINRPTIKVGNRFTSQMSAELGRILRPEKEGDMKDLIKLAKILRDKFKFPDVVTKARTNVAKEARSRISDAKNSSKPSSSGVNRNRSLADYYE